MLCGDAEPASVHNDIKHIGYLDGSKNISLSHVKVVTYALLVRKLTVEPTTQIIRLLQGPKGYTFGVLE